MKILRVGFTGTRKGMSDNQKEELENILADYFEECGGNVAEFHHGDCEGADEEAHRIAWYFTDKLVSHPPKESRYRAYTIGYMDVEWDGEHYGLWPEKDYLDRNKDIVNETDVLIAAPFTMKEELRSGTWSTVRYAKKRNKPVILLER